MNYNTVQGLVEELSLEFVLSDSSEPKSLSILLPILKNIKEAAGAISDDAVLKELSMILKNIQEVIESKTDQIEETFESIENSISGMKSFLHNLTRSGINNSPDNKKKSEKVIPESEGKIAANQNYEVIEESIEDFSRLISGFCPGEIPDLGSMLTILDQLIVQADQCNDETLLKVAKACKNYVENMTLEDIYNTKPIEEGLVLMKALQRHLKRGAHFTFEISDILALLAVATSREKELPGPVEIEVIEKNGEPQEQEGVKKIPEDDLEILVDFVTEAEENLDNIEVYLVELEQDPTDMEIINNIFRPFHTIKGVSGFLSLKKINKLAHTTENLLDSARSGEFIINDVATDAILESVDMLKQLIARVKTGIENGVTQQDEDIDADTLKMKLKHLQVSLVKGEPAPLGEILIRKGVVDQKSIDQSLKIQRDQPGRRIGEILVQEAKVSPKEISSALQDQRTIKKKISTQVKVSTQKLDDLVDFAGELVIAQSMLKQKASKDTDLHQSITQLGQIVTNMQTIAMSMRMIPIKATFMKMIRLVRDLSRKSGKEVSLNMEGEDTEIDRNVVDTLYEPMVHMIRNSMDHGIELSTQRLEKGKPSKGKIILRAYHKGGHIIIEIEDDGKGLDKDLILEKAESSGLISKNDQLTDAQVYSLIMEPGFSTAKEITDVSGRGVGMDVVKNGIEKFRGQLSIDSSKDIGTKFTISLPLTLAIIDGMLVRVGDERYVIPTVAIQRAFRPNKEDCFTVQQKGEMIKERNHLIPLVRLNEMYNEASESLNVWESLVVVVESKDEQKALLIDELLGKDEYVIKSLGASMEGIKGFAGGAILADGRVGLILDIHGVFEIADRKY